MNKIERLRKYIDDILLNISDIEERWCAYIHLYGVSQSCAMIAMKRNENVELATIAGMLHDLYSYKSMIRENHAHMGADLARNILNELELITYNETELICSAIFHHSDKNIVHTKFDEILKDADVFQHCFYNTTLPIKVSEKERYYNILNELSIAII